MTHVVNYRSVIWTRCRIQSHISVQKSPWNSAR